MTVAFFALITPSDLPAQTPRLVDIGGQRLEVSVAGQGEPVVVLEAGLSQDRRHWMAILDSVSNFTTVVAYSRAGYAGSEPSPSPRTPVQVMSELHSLLDALDLPPPYVLVGHSLGGIYARVFARRYPGEVVGLVLVDPSHERVFQLCSELADSPTFWQDTRRRFDRDADSIGGGTARELEELWRIFRRGTLPEAEPLPDVPMIVLTALRPDPSWVCTSEPSLRNLRQLHSELFDRTTQGAHVVTTESGHKVHDDQPGLVVESIRRIVRMIRPGSSPVSPTPASSNYDGVVPVYLSGDISCPYESLGKVSAEITVLDPDDFVSTMTEELGRLGRSRGADAVVIPAPEGRLRIRVEAEREDDPIRQTLEGLAVRFTDAECRT